jgi:hypothetical protein
MNYVDNKF